MYMSQTFGEKMKEQLKNKIFEEKKCFVSEESIYNRNTSEYTGISRREHFFN